MFAIRVLDSRGMPLVDSGRSSRRYGGRANVTLAPGREYTVEVFSCGYELARQTFRAEFGLVINHELERREER